MKQTCLYGRVKVAQTYRLELHSTLFGTKMVNRFYYQQSDDQGTAGDLILGFEEDVLPAISGIQSTDVRYDRIYAYELDDPSDVFDYLNLTILGGVRLCDAPAHTFGPFVTYTFTLAVNRRDVGNGRKAFSGVCEKDVMDNFALDPGNDIELALNACAIALFSNVRFSTGLDVPYQPVLYSPPSLSHPTTTLIPRLSSVAFRSVSTQNTRKS